MALHMVDDPNGQDDYVDNNSGGGGNRGGGGGGFNAGGLMAFLPLIIGLFRGRGNSGNNSGGQGKGGCGGKSVILLLVVAVDRKSTRLNSSHLDLSRMPSSA